MYKKLLFFLPIIIILAVLVFRNPPPPPDFDISFNEMPQIPVVANTAVFFSNLFTQVEPERAFEYQNQSLDGFILAAENEYIALYVQERTLAIKVKNKTTGYIFSSTLDEFSEHRLNDLWIRFVESAISIDFVRDGGSLTRESLTTGEINLIENGFIANIIFENSGINLNLILTIEDKDIKINIPQSSIIEPEGVQIAQLHLYPFFGAAKEDTIPGYKFIPDGSGALIRYGNRRMTSPFRENIYGANLGTGAIVSSTVRPPFSISMPVFGKAHGQDNAFIAIIESGDNYAEIVAHTSGLITEFNWVTAVFTYRYNFFQPTRRDGTGPSLLRLQDWANELDISITFRLLSYDNADYVGMALAYQDWLVQNNMLVPFDTNGPMMRLEFFGGERIPGAFFSYFQPMTYITDIPIHLNILNEHGVNDILPIFRSFTRGGSASFPTRFPVHSRLGDVQDAIEQVPNLFFHTDYSRAIDIGFFGRGNLAVGLNRRPFESFDSNFLLPSVAVQGASRDINYLQRMGINNIAMESTASYLHSALNASGSEIIGRGDQINALHEIVNILQPERLAFYTPNAYALAITDYFLDIPMSSTGHLFVTDSVPFMQIVLRGYVNYYAPFSNFVPNAGMDILNIIEYGAYPSFLLTSYPAHLLAESRSSGIFSSAFSSWAGSIIHYYNTIYEALSHVRGEKITGRVMLAPGISKTTYSNGVSIIVNYTSSDFYYNDYTAPAEWFVVV